MNSDYTLRRGEERDFPAVLGLIKELATFEKAADKVSNTVEQMAQDRAHFELFVVETNGQVIGMALYYFTYFTWVGKSLYLDDLYVKEAFRGQGIGQNLLKAIFKVAQDENCARLRWQVLDWNQPAIDLYDKIGADLDKEWVNCDFDKESIAQFLR